jgi:urease accessory protein
MQTDTAPIPLRPHSRADDCPTPAHRGRRDAAAAHPAGCGALDVAVVAGESVAIGCRSATPLRLLLPRARGRTVWAVAASHGGGLVGGDALSLELEVRAGAQACVTTQAETKVYRSERAAGRQLTRARIDEGALLALLPEPVSAFAGSSYVQEQRLSLAAGASLVLVDGFTAGRTARGERWAFRSLATRTEVVVDGRPVLHDALRLAEGEGRPVAARLAGVELLATVVLLGPRVAAAAAAVLAEVSARPAAPAPVLLTASPLADGVIVKVAAAGVEPGLAALRATLSFLPAILGEDPLSRRP